MALTLDAILQFIRSETAHPMRIQELAQAMKVSRREYPSFRQCVKKLIDEGRLVRLKRGRIGPADQMDIRTKGANKRFDASDMVQNER